MFKINLPNTEPFNPPTRHTMLNLYEERFFSDFGQVFLAKPSPIGLKFTRTFVFDLKIKIIHVTNVTIPSWHTLFYMCLVRASAIGSNIWPGFPPQKVWARWKSKFSRVCETKRKNFWNETRENDNERNETPVKRKRNFSETIKTKRK
jgi:hypothetical protein